LGAVVDVVGNFAVVVGDRVAAVVGAVSVGAAVVGASVGGAEVALSVAPCVGEIVAAVAAACPKLNDSIASVARDQPILFFIFPAPECSPNRRSHQPVRIPRRELTT
jgi:hypothetical protein